MVVTAGWIENRFTLWFINRSAGCTFLCNLPSLCILSYELVFKAVFKVSFAHVFAGICIMGVTRGAWHRGRASLNGIKIQKGSRSLRRVAAASECPPRLIRNCHTCFQYRRHLDSTCRHDLGCSERLLLLSSPQVYAPKVVIIYRDNVTLSILILLIIYLFTSPSSSNDTTAHCGLCPVEQSPSIFSYLSPTLYIFLLPALEDLFLLPFPFFLDLPPFLVPSSSWMKIFWAILSSAIPFRWTNQLILCPFIHFTIFSPLLISSSSRFVLLFHSPCSYLGQYIFF